LLELVPEIDQNWIRNFDQNPSQYHDFFAKIRVPFFGRIG